MGARALQELRGARRRRHVEELDVMEILYRVYLVAIFGGLGLSFLGGAIADPDVTGRLLGRLTNDAPAVLGVAVAVAILAGLRSGSRGGPLAIEAAEVQHVLLAPIDRSVPLRGLALRQLRTAAFVGAVVGLAVASFVLRRLPGPAAEWLACLGLLGAVVPVCTLGAAMIASGRRLRPAIATAAGAILVAWAAADLLAAARTSPPTLLGELATWPLQDGLVLWPLLGLGFAAAVACIGVLSVGGLSLEVACRRAALSAQLRFAAAMQDVRTVVLLRRQLAGEHPRRLPWARVGPARSNRLAVWLRDWQSFARWPAVRIARALGLGIAAGLCVVAGWDGTTPLFAVAGVVLFVAGLDAIEPLAQEVDHPTRRNLLPVPPGRLIQRHLVAPVAAMTGVLAVTTATAAAFGDPAQAAQIGAVAIVPTAILVVCAAALSATNDPFAHLFEPERGYAQTAIPPAIAAVSVAPVFAAREGSREGLSPVTAAASVELIVLFVAAGLIVWLGTRIAGRAAGAP